MMEEKRIIFIGADSFVHDAWKSGLSHENTEPIFFDFENVFEGMDMGITTSCPIVLRFKTFPSNYDKFIGWLKYLEGNSFPKEKLVVIHQIPNDDSENLGIINELTSAGHTCFDARDAGLVDHLCSLFV